MPQWFPCLQRNQVLKNLLLLYRSLQSQALNYEILIWQEQAHTNLRVYTSKITSEAASRQKRRWREIMAKDGSWPTEIWDITSNGTIDGKLIKRFANCQARKISIYKALKTKTLTSFTRPAPNGRAAAGRSCSCRDQRSTRMWGQGGERYACDATKARADRTSSFNTHQTRNDEKRLGREGRRA